MDWIKQSLERKLSEENQAREKERKRVEELPMRIAHAQQAFHDVLLQLKQDIESFNRLNRSSKRFHLIGHTVVQRGTWLLAINFRRCFFLWLEERHAESKFSVRIQYHPSGGTDYAHIVYRPKEPRFQHGTYDGWTDESAADVSRRLLGQYFDKLL
jgi:hypothetical protein